MKYNCLRRLTDGERLSFLFPNTRKIERSSTFRSLHSETNVHIALQHIGLEEIRFVNESPVVCL